MNVIATFCQVQRGGYPGETRTNDADVCILLAAQRREVGNVVDAGGVIGTSVAF
jgi:hypothetical protein